MGDQLRAYCKALVVKQINGYHRVLTCMRHSLYLGMLQRQGRGYIKVVERDHDYYANKKPKKVGKVMK